MIDFLRITLYVTLVVSIVNGAVLNHGNVINDDKGVPSSSPGMSDLVPSIFSELLKELSSPTDLQDDTSSSSIGRNLTDDMLVFNVNDEKGDEANDEISIPEVLLEKKEKEKETKSEKNLNDVAPIVIPEMIKGITQSKISKVSPASSTTEEDDDVEIVEIKKISSGPTTISETIRELSHPKSGTINNSQTMNSKADTKEDDDEISTVSPACEGEKCGESDVEEIKQSLLITKNEDNKTEKNEDNKNDDNDDEFQKEKDQKDEANDTKRISNLINSIQEAIETSQASEEKKNLDIPGQSEENEDETEDDKMKVNQFNPLNEELQLFPID